MSEHAFTQLTARLGIPTPHARELLTGSAEEDGAWKGELLSQALSSHLSHSRERYLVRRIIRSADPV